MIDLILLSIILKIQNSVQEIKQSSFQIASAAACCTWWLSAAPPFQGSRSSSWGSQCCRPHWTHIGRHVSDDVVAWSIRFRLNYSHKLDNKQKLSLFFSQIINLFISYVLLFQDFLALTGALYIQSRIFTQPIKILSIYASICRFWAIWYVVTSYNTMHVAERNFFGRINKALEICHYPTRYYSTTRLLSSLPYPTLPETEKPLPFRPWPVDISKRSIWTMKSDVTQYDICLICTFFAVI